MRVNSIHCAIGFGFFQDCFINMSQRSIENDVRFNVILKTLDSCKHIHEQLNQVEQLNSIINDQHIVNLIALASEVEFNLKDEILRGPNYNELLKHSSELQVIVSLISRLDKSIDHPEKFSEAADLLEQIDYFHREYGHQVPLIESIYKQSERRREILILNLCDKLEHLKDSSVEQASSIVRQLLRCGNFSDRELRLKYLQARDSWFNNACEEQASSFDSVVSVYCQGLPMIFNEYKSIFGTSGEILKEDRNHLVKVSSIDTTKEDGAIINSWLLLKTSIFIASLEVYLKNMKQSGTQTPTMLGDTMHKCFKLTSWLASIGFDFSSQLKPLFTEAINDEVKFSIEKATSKFETSFAATISKSVETLLLPVDDEILRISNMRPEEQIPKSLEHYPIFRIYCLQIVDSLRWLQATKSTLSPISLCLDTYAALNSSLTRVMKALAIILNMDNNSNHPILSKIAISFVTEFLPFMIDYCGRLFPEKVILSAIGLTKSEFKTISLTEPERLKNFRIDLRQITDPLKSTMPSLIQSVES